MLRSKIVNISDYSLEELQYSATDKIIIHTKSFKNEKRRLSSLCGYFIATQLLCDNFALKQKDIDFFFDENGKPFLYGKKFYFNFAHSGDKLLCAVSDKCVGVDIERKEIRNFNSYKKFCNISEQAFVEKNIETNFFKIWCAKEAYQKLTGKGISYDLTKIQVANEDRLLDTINGKLHYFGEADGYLYSIVN